VLKIGNPFLRKIADSVETIDQTLRDGVVQDMLDTMAAENGAGIAAPQIGISLRIVIFGIETNPRYPDAEPVPLTILINPKIQLLTTETESLWEGCLSVPEYRGLVPRCKRIHYSGFNEMGEPISVEAEGFHARVVLHEVDHLDGILFPERIEDPSQFGMLKELEDAGIIPKVATKK